MKSASYTSIITALKFTCCSSLSVSYQQNWKLAEAPLGVWYDLCLLLST